MDYKELAISYTISEILTNTDYTRDDNRSITFDVKIQIKNSYDYRRETIKFNYSLSTDNEFFIQKNSLWGLDGNFYDEIKYTVKIGVDKYGFKLQNKLQEIIPEIFDKIDEITSTLEYDPKKGKVQRRELDNTLIKSACKK